MALDKHSTIHTHTQLFNKERLVTSGRVKSRSLERHVYTVVGANE